MFHRPVWCPINLAEGRDFALLETLADAFASRGVVVADWSADYDHNRSVFSLLGELDALQAAVLRGVGKAIARLKFAGYAGVHPAFGVVDVIPFVKVGETSEQEVKALAEATCLALADRFGLGVFKYGWVATSPERSELPDLRRLLRANLHQGTLKPDCGTLERASEIGVTCLGARGELIAYNIVVEAPLEVAKSVAKAIREAAGGLPGVRALGLPLQNRGLAQVSMNVFRPEATRLEVIFDTVQDLVEKAGGRVLESELIGLVSRRWLPADYEKRLKLARFKPEQVLEYWLKGQSNDE